MGLAGLFVASAGRRRLALSQPHESLGGVAMNFDSAVGLTGLVLGVLSFAYAILQRYEKSKVSTLSSRAIAGEPKVLHRGQEELADA